MDDLNARRIPLGTFPTPIHQHESLGRLLGVNELWIKRDDLTGFGWGGNKVRTVEYLIWDALNLSATTVIMAAGPSSNFAAVMSAAAAAVGLAVEQICYGNRPSNPPIALQVSLAQGTVVHFTGSEERATMEQVAHARATALVDGGEIPYIVPRGGASDVGALGFLNAAVELQTQLRANRLQLAHVVIPVGSGGSISGLAAGREILGETWSLSGVSVSRPPDQMLDHVQKHAMACAATGGAPLCSLAPIKVIDGRGTGFGISDPEDLDLAAAIERDCGLLVDPVYGAKALRWLAGAGFSNSADDNADGPVLYWHTGGTLGVVSRFMKSMPPTNKSK